MKSTKAIGIGLVAIVSVLAVYEFSQAAAKKTITAARIGVVNVRDVAERCKARAVFEKKLTQESEKAMEEIQKLEQEIENDKAALGTRKQGSNDYAEMAQKIMIKNATLNVKNEFYKQQFAAKQIRSEEQLYRAIMKAVKKVAEASSLDMVFSSDGNYLTNTDIPDQSASLADFMLTVKTHKLLYFSKQIDITDEVVSEVDIKK